MLALRSAVYLLFLTVTVIPWGILSCLTFPIRNPRRYEIITLWTTMAIWGARHIAGIDYQVIGRENIPDPRKHGGVIFLSKHQSRYETLLFRTLFRHMCYVYKHELHWIPFFGWGIFLCDMIPINRAKGKEALEQVAEIGGAKLKAGWNMILFPEGTRVLPGHKRRYKVGGTHLSVATGVSVVPIAHNAGDVWPRDRWIKTPGTVTVVIGAPIAPTGLTPEEQMAKVEDWIEAEMRARFPHQYASKR
ncbi:MAG: 1-acyl-sn-glycerol-3-phosphate acyltransferase [Burkholderiales bacterium]|nr:1-acyl-sn-glycerol-3-phosphate acyltransferase [Burkholderiales bacterium]